MANVLKSIGGKPITYDNYFYLRNRALISYMQVNYVLDIIFARDKANIGMFRTEAIHVISDIG